MKKANEKRIKSKKTNEKAVCNRYGHILNIFSNCVVEIFLQACHTGAL